MTIQTADTTKLPKKKYVEEGSKKYFFLAIDVDDTILSRGFPDISKAIPNYEVMYKINRMEHRLSKWGFTTIRIMWTCRSNNSQGTYLDDAVNWCKEQDFRIDYVNENPLCPFTNDMGDIYSETPKIFYHLLIDDRTMNLTKDFEDIVVDADAAFKKTHKN